ncbi:nuclear transport factor 2 family protein [Brevibacterium ihuae]|uniref:nuclear transport factor 2 family protein n=1 Tax=Brevibacterium ihuae TaxID=1631743 RepID=UPI000C760655|nr:nuclear transport factor 2 family protein [Brevibacterium ihuae]
MTDIRELVLTADRELFTEHDLSTLDRNFAADYVEHSPLVANGKDGLRELVTGAGDRLRHDVARVLVDEEKGLVALHGAYPGLDPDTVYVGFDIYRVADGKIVEHWDGLVEQTPPNASGRTQLDGPTDVDGTVDSEASRAFVEKAWSRFLQGQDYAAAGEFTRADDRFAQHSGDIADGVQNMVDFLEQLKADGSALTYDTLHRSVADGNFVLTYSEGSIAGERHFFCELWRIEDGAWVELWDAIGPVAPDDELAHPHGAFASTADAS